MSTIEARAKLTGLLRVPAPGSGSPGAADGPAYEREEQGEYPGDRQDRAQPRDVAREASRDIRIREADPYGSSQERQDYRDHQRQQGHQEAMLDSGAARHASRSVAPYEEGKKEGQQKPHEARDPGLRAATEPQRRKDRADDHADDAAQDQAGPQSREPAEENTCPARARIFFSKVPLARTILLKAKANPYETRPRFSVRATLPLT